MHRLIADVTWKQASTPIDWLCILFKYGLRGYEPLFVILDLADSGFEDPKDNFSR